MKPQKVIPSIVHEIQVIRVILETHPLLVIHCLAENGQIQPRLLLKFFLAERRDCVRSNHAQNNLPTLLRAVR